MMYSYIEFNHRSKNSSCQPINVHHGVEYFFDKSAQLFVYALDEQDYRTNSDKNVMYSKPNHLKGWDR